MLWPKDAIGDNDGYGQPLLSRGVEVRVRWDDTAADVLDAQGNRIKVDATALVDREMTVGSELWLGQLSDWIGTALGQDNETRVMVVKTYNAVPDVRNRYVARTVGLMKKSSTRNEQA